jgi:hypothetical protein
MTEGQETGFSRVVEWRPREYRRHGQGFYPILWTDEEVVGDRD